MWPITISWLERQRWEFHAFFRRETKNVFIWVLLTILVAQLSNELKNLLIWYIILGGCIWFLVELISISIRAFSTKIAPWKIYRVSDWFFPACPKYTPIIDQWPKGIVVTAFPWPAIFKPSKDWENYVVEFKAKELKLNAIAWVLRSSGDGMNCLMLLYNSEQKEEGFRPHIFSAGTSLDDRSRDESVRRLTAGYKVQLQRSEDGYVWIRSEVFNQNSDTIVVRIYDLNAFCKLVFEWVIPIKLFEDVIPGLRGMTKGSIGFRNCDFEMARYRKIRMRKFIS